MTPQIYLFIAIIIFYFFAFFFRSFLLWKNTGINPLTFDDTDNAHGFNGKLFKIIGGLGIIVVAIYSFSSHYYQYLLPFWYLENEISRLIGWILLHLSFFWIFAAQLQMANSWRIGIDFKNKTNLVTHGLFSFSRNPIFFGIILVDIGLFLVIPNAFTLLIAALSISSIHTQVRLEEGFLKKVHEEKYEKYVKKVRRWI
jgi:protein-S-isoprenylcysteine O-methyltransferase Ste14